MGLRSLAMAELMPRVSDFFVATAVGADEQATPLGAASLPLGDSLVFLVTRLVNDSSSALRAGVGLELVRPRWDPTPLRRAASDAWPEFMRAALPPNVRLPEGPMPERIVVLSAGAQADIVDPLALDLPVPGRYVIHLLMSGERIHKTTVRAA